MSTDFPARALGALRGMAEMPKPCDISYQNATDLLNEAKLSKERKMTESYLNQQLLTVAPFLPVSGQNGQFRIKITSDKGETKWMNISNEQFKAIESALEENL